jgi:tRNA pseudouridine38-40 synthase
MRHVLALEYDGRAFCGFQSQPRGCAVQDALERALASVCGHTLRIAAAGRTDAGVHATSQVVHFDTAAERPDTAFVRGVNANLPPGAAVLWTQPIDDDFHARFSATARHYAYLLQNRAERPGLLAGRVGWHHRALDVDAMQEGARHLIGTHDYSAFRAAGCQAKTPVRTLQRLDVSRRGALVRFDVTANAFLHHMVRNIVGALVCVGLGREAPAWIGALLEARDRTRAAPTFPPDGLYFNGADYPSSNALPPTRRDIDLVID